jgi:hypothetical protein
MKQVSPPTYSILNRFKVLGSRCGSTTLGAFVVLGLASTLNLRVSTFCTYIYFKYQFLDYTLYTAHSEMFFHCLVQEHLTVAVFLI